ncbi:MAG: cbb3-type cytochrome c oxidase subunit I [Acidimicrobiales bacterium]
MTITESPPTTTAADDAARLDTDPLDGGVLGVLTTTDHKAIGAMYVRSSLVFAAAMTIVGAFAGLERIDPDSVDIFGGATALAQTVSLYRTGLAVLVVMPLLVGLGTVVVPLQVGATSIAFPRASAAGFWTWLVGAGAYIGSFIVDGGFVSGNNVDNRAVALTIASLGVSVAGLVLGMVCIATTVIALRPKGMSLTRVPVFAWSMMIAAVVWLLSMAVLIADLVIDYVALQHTDREVDALASIAWMLSGPQVFAFVIPALGIIAEIIPVSTQQRQQRYGVLLGAIAAFGLLSFGAFAQSAYDLGPRDVTEEFFYIVVGVALLLPMLLVVGAILDTLTRGRKRVAVSAAFVGAFGALVMLLAGVGANAVRVIGHWRERADWNETRIMDVGVMHYALLAGLIAGVAGIYFWSPKIFGRRFNDGFGRLAVVALVLGTVVVALPDVVAGFIDDSDFLDVLGFISMAGGFVVAAGALLALGGVALGLLSESNEVVPANPWHGYTFEWATASPPPVGNFEAPVPVVSSPTPLLDIVDELDGSDTADATSPRKPSSQKDA